MPKGVGHEEAFYGRADHRVLEGSGFRGIGAGVVPEARVLGRLVLQVEGEIRWYGRVRGQAAQDPGRRERAPEEAAG